MERSLDLVFTALGIFIAAMILMAIWLSHQIDSMINKKTSNNVLLRNAVINAIVFLIAAALTITSFASIFARPKNVVDLLSLLWMSSVPVATGFAFALFFNLQELKKRIRA